MQVELIRDREGFDRLAGEWNVLLAEDSSGRLGMDVTNTFESVSAVLDSFLQGKDWLILIARDAAGIAGILPVYRRDKKPGNLLAPRILSPMTNLHGGRNGFLVRDGRPDILQLLFDHLLQEIPGWDLFNFQVVRGGRSDQMVAQLSRNITDGIRKRPSKASPFLVMADDYEAWMASLKSSLRQNLRRHQRQLQKLGSLGFELHRTPDQIPRYWEAMMEIEKSSWKQETGSSIACKPEQEAFYRSLLPHAAGAGQWLSGLLTLDDEPIAHHLSVVWNGVVVGLKITYTEKFKKHAPGSVLQWMYLQHVHALGIRCFDFSGEAENHKMQWTDDTYQLTGMRLFRPTVRGRIARLRNRLGQLKRQGQEPS